MQIILESADFQNDFYAFKLKSFAYRIKATFKYEIEPMKTCTHEQFSLASYFLDDVQVNSLWFWTLQVLKPGKT